MTTTRLALAAACITTVSLGAAVVSRADKERTGADEATTLTTDGDITVGTLKVPKGSYALFTIPSQKNSWQLIVNKNPKQWGAFKYDPKDDLGKTAMKVGSGAEPVEQLTLSLEPNGPKKATLKLAWDDLVASVPIVAP